MKTNRAPDWSPEEDGIVARIWASSKPLKECLDELPGRTYDAVIRRACNLGLGKRENAPKGQSQIAWKLIEAELMKAPGDRFEIARRARLHAATVHRYIECNRDKVHVIDWTHRHNAGPFLPVYAYGPGEDLPIPEKQSKVQIGRRVRERKKIARVLAGETVKVINPFAAAAGFISAPTGKAGRVIKHLHDDDSERDMEQAA